MTYNVLMGTLNPSHSLTHSLTHSTHSEVTAYWHDIGCLLSRDELCDIINFLATPPVSVIMFLVRAMVRVRIELVLALKLWLGFF